MEAVVWPMIEAEGLTGPFAEFVRARDRTGARVAVGEDGAALWLRGWTRLCARSCHPIGRPCRIPRSRIPAADKAHSPFAMSIALCNGASQPSRIAETENGAPTSGATPLPSKKVPFHV